MQSDPTAFQTHFDQRIHTLGFDVAAIITIDGAVIAQAAGSDASLIARPSASDFADSQGRRTFCGVLSNGRVFVALRPIEELPDSAISTPAAPSIPPATGFRSTLRHSPRC